MDSHCYPNRLDNSDQAAQDAEDEHEDEKERVEQQPPHQAAADDVADRQAELRYSYFMMPPTEVGQKNGGDSSPVLVVTEAMCLILLGFFDRFQAPAAMERLAGFSAPDSPLFLSSIGGHALLQSTAST